MICSKFADRTRGRGLKNSKVCGCDMWDTPCPYALFASLLLVQFAKYGRTRTCMTTSAKDCASREPLCAPLRAIFVRSEVGMVIGRADIFTHNKYVKQVVVFMTMTEEDMSAQSA